MSEAFIVHNVKMHLAFGTLETALLDCPFKTVLSSLAFQNCSFNLLFLPSNAGAGRDGAQPGRVREGRQQLELRCCRSEGQRRRRGSRPGARPRGRPPRRCVLGFRVLTVPFSNCAASGPRGDSCMGTINAPAASNLMSITLPGQADSTLRRAITILLLCSPAEEEAVNGVANLTQAPSGGEQAASAAMAPASKPLAPGSKVCITLLHLPSRPSVSCAVWYCSTSEEAVVANYVAPKAVIGPLSAQHVFLQQKQGRFEVSTEELPADSVRAQSAPGTPSQPRCDTCWSRTLPVPRHRASLPELWHAFAAVPHDKLAHQRSCVGVLQTLASIFAGPWCRRIRWTP